MRGSVAKRLPVGATAAVAGLVALVVAGCGGGGSSTSAGASGASGASGSAPLSKDEYVSQANAVCKEANDRIEALQAPASNQLSDVAKTVEEELPINQEALEKFTALTPPADLQAKADQIAALGKSQIALAQQLVKTNDVNQANALIARAKPLGDRFDSIAASMGLGECAKSPSPQG